MRVHCFQHVPWDGPAFFPTWASRRGHDWSVTLVPDAPRLPALSSFDALVMLGGPMSLRDHRRYPWLTAEKRYLERVLAADKPFFGICLGAQMLAEVHGAAVKAAPHREIGWFPLELAAAGRETWAGDAFPPNLEAFFWHEEAFETPRQATRLAGTAANRHQGFVLGASFGLQFHLEATPEWAAHLARRDAAQLVPAAYVQRATDILARPHTVYERSHRVLQRLLDRWLDPARRGAQRAASAGTVRHATGPGR